MNSKKRDVVLVGCGGFGTEVATYLADVMAEQSLVVSDVVDAGAGRFAEIEHILGESPARHGSYDSIRSVQKKAFVLCFGDPIVRLREFAKIKALGGQFLTVVHPRAYIATTARVCEGTIVAPFAFVGPHAVVGANCALNVRATVGHDAVLGHSVVVSPHVNINGSARCGDCSFLGSGVILHPGTNVGRYVKIASASVVKFDVGDGELAAGNPAKGRKMFVVPEGEIH